MIADIISAPTGRLRHHTSSNAPPKNKKRPVEAHTFFIFFEQLPGAEATAEGDDEDAYNFFIFFEQILGAEATAEGAY